MAGRCLFLVCLSGGLLLLASVSCKDDEAGPRGSVGRAVNASKACPPLDEDEWRRIRDRLEHWYAAADPEVLLVEGIHDQAFLISKSKIEVHDDGETVRFAADPEQPPEGMVFLMPQNAWFDSLDKALKSMKSFYANGEGYVRKVFSATSLEQVRSRDEPAGSDEERGKAPSLPR
jgi:hypothetical protein